MNYREGERVRVTGRPFDPETDGRRGEVVGPMRHGLVEVLLDGEAEPVRLSRFYVRRDEDAD